MIVFRIVEIIITEESLELKSLDQIHNSPFSLLCSSRCAALAMLDFRRSCLFFSWNGEPQPLLVLWNYSTERTSTTILNRKGPYHLKKIRLGGVEETMRRFSLRRELPCILCLIKVKLFKFWPNILVKQSITMKPNTCNMKIYFMTILMMVILYFKY
jgi:hypothetical protein